MSKPHNSDENHKYFLDHAYVAIKIVRQYFSIVSDKDEVTGQNFLLLEHFFLRRRTLKDIKVLTKILCPKNNKKEDQKKTLEQLEYILVQRINFSKMQENN